MKEIEKFNKMIEEEMEGAWSYAREGAMYKEELPEFSKKFVNMANQELEHIQMIHTMVVSLINEYRNKNGTPPTDMLAVYDYLHKKHIDEVAELKYYISMI